jgi:hypothetical protein
MINRLFPLILITWAYIVDVTDDYHSEHTVTTMSTCSRSNSGPLRIKYILGDIELKHPDHEYFINFLAKHAADFFYDNLSVDRLDDGCYL